MEIATIAYGPLIQHRYKLLRYEDVAQSPHRTLRKLLPFLGLDANSQSVMTFLDKNTKSYAKTPDR